jgi:hypothetical protein
VDAQVVEAAGQRRGDTPYTKENPMLDNDLTIAVQTLSAAGAKAALAAAEVAAVQKKLAL